MTIICWYTGNLAWQTVPDINHPISKAFTQIISETAFLESHIVSSSYIGTNFSESWSNSFIIFTCNYFRAKSRHKINRILKISMKSQLIFKISRHKLT